MANYWSIRRVLWARRDDRAFVSCRVESRAPLLTSSTSLGSQPPPNEVTSQLQYIPARRTVVVHPFARDQLVASRLFVLPESSFLRRGRSQRPTDGSFPSYQLSTLPPPENPPLVAPFTLPSSCAPRSLPPILPSSSYLSRSSTRSREGSSPARTVPPSRRRARLSRNVTTSLSSSLD